jgi:hypothetical protein
MLRISFTAGFIAGLTTAAVICGPALAQSNPNLPPCYNDKVSNSGSQTIRMVSGQVFQAYPGSAGRLAGWLPLDKVEVCYLGGSAVQITDLNNNKQIKALRK